MMMKLDDMRQNVLCKFVRGSTLIEVLTALLIISISFALTTSLFSSVFERSDSHVKVQAWFEMNKWLDEIYISHEYIISSKIFEGYQLTCDVEEQECAEGLIKLILTANDINGNELLRRELLVLTP